MNRGELSLKMSRKPKTFLVLLLVSAFLMTQVAMAGAATVNWNPLSTLYTNSTVSGTIYGTAYGTAYAYVKDMVYNEDSKTLSTPVFSTAQYIYNGKPFNFNMAAFTGLTLNRQYQVGLVVYEAGTADTVYLDTTAEIVLNENYLYFVQE